ncbi:hypothetical protein BLOT_015900 [Blomia tropicalis]|nr:hypothetical protein BLOT_015900 [Blomia tropicalis]
MFMVIQFEKRTNSILNYTTHKSLEKNVSIGNCVEFPIVQLANVCTGGEDDVMFPFDFSELSFVSFDLIQCNVFPRTIHV